VLVEDNLDDAELILRAFAKNHLANEIVVLRDGQEAVDWFFGGGGRPAVPPEVVLLDLKLPKLDGFEVLRRLRANEGTKRVPVVVFTSSREKADIARSYDLHANGFVQKPLALSDLVATVQRLGSYWLIANEPPPSE
jgi:CheY-like chemotaxis protein